MRSEKSHLVNFIGGLLKDSDYVYFVTYKGLAVKEISDFRVKVTEMNAECHVLKNRLIKKAAELFEFDALAPMELKESTALISGTGDPSAVAQVISEFGKQHEQLAAKGGYFEGELLSATDVKAIAALPPKEILQAQLLSVLQAPARNLVSVLNTKATSIVNVINAYKDKLEK